MLSGLLPAAMVLSAAVTPVTAFASEMDPEEIATVKGNAVSIPIHHGKYIVRETTTPHNFTPIDDFKVTNSEQKPSPERGCKSVANRT